MDIRNTHKKNFDKVSGAKFLIFHYHFSALFGNILKIKLCLFNVWNSRKKSNKSRLNNEVYEKKYN